MKREFLEGLNLSKDVIDQIMAENGKDINAQKALTEAETAKLNTANQTITQLRDKVKSFDGIDVGKLQSDLAALQDKYNMDIDRLKLDNALDSEQENPGTYVDSGKPHGGSIGNAPTTMRGALAARYEQTK